MMIFSNLISTADTSDSRRVLQPTPLSTKQQAINEYWANLADEIKSLGSLVENTTFKALFLA